MNTRRWELAGLGAIALAGLSEGLMDTMDWQPARGTVERRGRMGLPNVALTAHTGQTLRFYDDVVRDKLVVITMMYAGCNNTCPPSTQNLVRVQELLGDRVGRDIFMYSITLRPEQDSPQDLADYAKLHRVKPGWLFLTGGRDDIELLRRALGFYDPDPKIDGREGRHVGMVRIGNEAIGRWGMSPALAEPRQVVSAILHLDRWPQAAAT
jgi:protein SCO1/2